MTDAERFDFAAIRNHAEKRGQGRDTPLLALVRAVEDMRRLMDEIGMYPGGMDYQTATRLHALAEVYLRRFDFGEAA